MNSNGEWKEPPGLQFFNDNQRNITLEYLIPYEGKHVAWSADGTRILASGEDMAEVEKNLVAGGIDPSQVVFDYVERFDVSYLG